MKLSFTAIFLIGIPRNEGPVHRDGQPENWFIHTLSLSKSYIKDVKEYIEVQVPGSDLTFVVVCAEDSKCRVSSALLDDLSLNLGYSSAGG